MKLQLLAYLVVLRPKGNFTLIVGSSEVNFHQYCSDINAVSLLPSAVWSERTYALRGDNSKGMVTFFFFPI